MHMVFSIPAAFGFSSPALQEPCAVWEVQLPAEIQVLGYVPGSVVHSEDRGIKPNPVPWID